MGVTGGCSISMFVAEVYEKPMPMSWLRLGARPPLVTSPGWREDGLAVLGMPRASTTSRRLGPCSLTLSKTSLPVKGPCEVDETTQTCLEGVYGGVHVVAVESEGGFEAEAVSGDEAAGFDTRGPESVPQGDSGVGVYDDFYTVLSGVAGAGDEGIRLGRQWRRGARCRG